LAYPSETAPNKGEAKQETMKPDEQPMMGREQVAPLILMMLL
jgi:hypothetical protein